MSGQVCSFEGCNKPRMSKGFCTGHYQQSRTGKELRPLKVYGQNLVCSFEGCDRPHLSTGFCKGHYLQLRTGKELRPIKVYKQNLVCSVEDCGRPHLSRGFCNGHYKQSQEGKRLSPIKVTNYAPICTIQGCGGLHHSGGLCKKHYNQQYRRSKPNAKRLSEHKRRAQKLSTQVGTIDLEIAWKRSGGICFLCGVPMNRHIPHHWFDSKGVQHRNPGFPSLEHIIPLSRGGTHTQENLTYTHLICNITKNNRVLTEIPPLHSNAEAKG